LAEGFAASVGREIRHARTRRGWTLKRLKHASEGRFKPSSVAAYERGERDISLRRFCDLASVLGVSPVSLLAAALGPTHIAEAHPTVRLDRSALSKLPADKSALVSSFVEGIVATRHLEDPGAGITIRSGDLEVLAITTGMEPEDLFDEPATSGPVPGTQVGHRRTEA
jgi:transcriptional regulator with XRE-family HTH domain